MVRAGIVAIALAGFSFAAAAQHVAPRIWDDAALADWATPVAGLNVRPAHYSSAEYYASPADNLRTYPVYQPDQEPAGYWEWLQQQKPEPLVDARQIRTEADWIAAGERAFRDLDSALLRTDDPVLIAQARDPNNFRGVFTFADGSVLGPRWVVTADGVQLSARACGACHGTPRGTDGRNFPGPPAPGTSGLPVVVPGMPLVGAAGTVWRQRRFYPGDTAPVAAWRDFTVPWAPDERIERLKTLSIEPGTRGFGRSFGGGVFARSNGSPYAVTKVVDLQNVRYSRYLDATATHRLRGPEDIARYAALVTGADRMDFGPHRILTDEQRRVRFHYADEVLYAIGVYLMSLEPPRNPNLAPSDVMASGEQVFRREGCARCHQPPAYTTGQLTVADGFSPPENHPNRDDIERISVGTDPDVALKTRKGTGLYKIPTLRGVWYRSRLLHDGSLTSLEELFDPARLNPEYEPRGWNPPLVTKRAVAGHAFGLSLRADEKHALLAFLRSL